MLLSLMLLAGCQAAGPGPPDLSAVHSTIRTRRWARRDVEVHAHIPAAVGFAVPAGVTSTRLEVRTSGHGGGSGDAACIGPAEEFCHRALEVRVDAQPLTPTVDPWRDDCDSYCTTTTYTPFSLT